jgi:putative ABC transport system permease protein
MGAERIAAGTSGVSAVESWIGKAAVLDRPDGTKNETLNILGMPYGTTFVGPKILAGRWLEAGDKDAIVVNTDARKAEPSLDVGQRVTLEIGGETSTWHVVGLVTGQLSGPAIYTDREVLGAYIGDQSVTQTLLKTETSDPLMQRAALDRAEQRLDDAGYRVVSARTQAELRDSIANELGILVWFLWVMAVLLASVGIIGLTGTMSINVIESTREIGVMRAIGAQHISIYQIFITEGLVVGFMSWTIGAAIAYPMSKGLTSLLSGAIGIPLSYRFSWSGVATWLGVIAAISFVASLAPAFRASQVSVRDAISYE